MNLIQRQFIKLYCSLARGGRRDGWKERTNERKEGGEREKQGKKERKEKKQTDLTKNLRIGKQ